ncbi:DUF7680 family protein [Desulfofundulus thermosubterraneus]|uniref:DUF7680 domain-containing protein n=1 Tax=Desulfofundulus thermosubterraneus DSM 16057 TaxID=1121432 RepID=A0A1M6CPZ3_9FIRM|nr:hypothetical protein [Desulfofundulus thermosubterraneus]SHI62953.1 hypothetical protein SAMN02745219_00715 [Desulfofundulus thermosubterraneus DSM 16057]
MANRKSNTSRDLLPDLQHRIQPLLKSAPWVLRVTEYKDKPAPVLVIKERGEGADDPGKNGGTLVKAALKDRGLLYGQPLRRCLPVIRIIVSHVCDHAGIPLELQRYFGDGRITFRGNLPLDEEAGAKLALIFKLREGIKDMDRVELIAWRVQRFSREEAVYWLTRATQYGEAANRWARSGMRIMLSGQPGDKEILHLLEKLRK